MSFETVQNRLLRAKMEHPTAQWPEILLRRQEARALIVEVKRAAPTNKRLA